MEAKYHHDEIHHNLIAPSIIVPFLVETIQPKSVVDVGCGIGTFLNQFNKCGVEDILGFDGEWLDLELLSKYVDASKVNIVDLEKPIDINRKFDLAISLEVAEHLSEESADVFVNNLTQLSDIIIFSAAFPGQGGQNHINEQWPNYWIEKFQKFHFQAYDVIRPIFWGEEKIDVWYRQNMFLIIKNDHSKKDVILNKIRQAPKTDFQNIIHPEYFYSEKKRKEELDSYYKEYRKVKTGNESFLFYIKLFIKYILVNLRLRK